MIEQMRDEKMAMYMKLTKCELAEMLVNCNDALAVFLVSPEPVALGRPGEIFQLRRPWA